MSDVVLRASFGAKSPLRPVVGVGDVLKPVLIGHFSLDQWPKLLKASLPSVATVDANVLSDDLRSGGRHLRAPKKRN